jgi:hypothetical protein
MAVRTALCGVNGIYIDANASESWGFRTPPPKPPTPPTLLRRYIGLASSLWSPGPHAITFSTYETRRLRTASNSTQVSLVPGTGTDTPQETVLAALVHEYGHILWYDTFKPNGGYASGTQFGPIDPTQANCKFFRSWNTPLTGPPEFRDFASVDLDSSGNVVNEHANNGSSDNVRPGPLSGHSR